MNQVKTQKQGIAPDTRKQCSWRTKAMSLIYENIAPDIRKQCSWHTKIMKGISEKPIAASRSTQSRSSGDYHVGTRRPRSGGEGTTGCLVVQNYFTTIFFPLRM
jgi:hypothetical protein